MPFSSAEIAASIGAFQGQSMNNVAYSQMIGMGGYQGQADRMAGGAMSRIAGIGAPLMSGALGLAGLDPMSLGLKAGMSAFGGGSGLLGAGMTGLGAMGMAAGGLGVAGFAGSQVFAGAQQQAQLNGALRGSFNFQNPNGTQGFNRSDTGSIGNMMRNMTHQFGPEGQITGMGELTQLAANMGKMGMSTGVKDAQEFSRKFREMLTTLKTVARELGTSLEEAQQFAQAQRGSGIFRAADQMKFASQARGTSAAGGLALSEVTGMASIGSQISRSVGGTGRQGAFGGMMAIGQVGSAIQTGALSEESIYNATGLTGAEGRQAMASNMMAQTGSFLKSGRGRYFLASMAGKNGSLDEDSVQNWMMGGMSVGETKSQANKNLAGVGRANFIRNEGRLRGAVMEKFGALAPTMAYQQWLSSRGYDPNNMDDKSMLAFQRFSGMGRDEADNAISMVQKLPEMMVQQRQASQDDRRGQEMSRYQQTHGLEGMKRRFAQVREGIQGKLQQVGQELFTSGADMIEQWWNSTMDVYERRLSGDVDKVWNSSKMGGVGGKQLHALLKSGNGASLFGGTVEGDPMRKALETSKNLQNSAAVGGMSQQTTEFAKNNRDWIRDAYTTSLSKVTSERRISEFGSTLKARADSGDKQAQELYKTWKGSSASDRAGLLGSIEQQVGISKDVSLAKSWELPELGQEKGLFRTVRQGDVAVGRAVMGDKAFRSGGEEGGIMGQIGRGAGRFLDTFIKRQGGGDLDLKNRIDGLASGGEAMAAEIGGYTRSEEGAGVMRGLVMGDKSSIESAQKEIQEINIRGRGGELSARDKGVRTLLQQSMLGAEFANVPSGGPALDALLAKADSMLGRKPGTTTPADLQRFKDQARGIVGAQAREDVMHLTDRAREESGLQGRAFVKSGLAVEKNGVLSLTAGTEKALGTVGSQAAKLALQSINLAGKLGTDPSANADTLEQMQALSGQQYESIANMTTADKRRFARGVAGTEAGAMAGESLMREQRMRSLIRSKGGGAKGQIGAISSQLGVEFGKDELAGMAGKDAGAVTDILMGKLGSQDEGLRKQLLESISATKGGQIGKGADLLNRALEQAPKDIKEKIKGATQQRDPMSEMADAAKQSNRFLEALVKSNDAAKAILQGIEAKTGKTGDAEDPSKKPPGK